MAEKRRALPSWMSGREDKGNAKEPMKSKRKRKVARTAFYCMNEQELVEAAAACLSACGGAIPHSDQKSHPTLAAKKNFLKYIMILDQNKGGNATAQTKEDLTCAATDFREESEELTYVSESDLDITEVETLPYAGIPGPQRSGGQTSEAGDQTDAGQRADGGGPRSQTPEDTDKDDALRLVREIFFN